MQEAKTNKEETFIITLVKADGEDLWRYPSESLIKSLLEKGSFFEIIDITKMSKKK